MEVDPLHEFVPMREKLENLRFDVGPRHASLVEVERHPASVDTVQRVGGRDREEVEKSVPNGGWHAASAKVADDVVKHVRADSVTDDVGDVWILKVGNLFVGRRCLDGEE